MDNLESRVTDLEIQISHQTKMLEELNTVILFQQKTLEKIQKANDSIIQNLQEFYKTNDQSFSTHSKQ